ncbi:MAG: GlxA family transcriptional regulator [Rhizobiaceae bacterium]
MNSEPAVHPAPYKIGMLLLDGFNAMASQAFIDPFRSANYLRGMALYKWDFLALDVSGVEASNGLNITCFNSIDGAPPDYDLLVVNASWSPERFVQPRLLAFLRTCAQRRVAVCGLDTGAFILAHAGLLKNRNAAIHYEHIAAFRELFPDIGMGEDLFVIDGDRLTCCGGLAGTDLALEIIRHQHGLQLANAASRYIFHERIRNGAEGQLPQSAEPGGYSAPDKLRAAIILMEANLEQPVKIAAVADHVGLSQRQLDRMFRQHSGVSPVRYYLDVRLDRARGLVTQTQLAILNVAIACGFSGNSQFSRAYKKRFGISPTGDRIEGRLPFQFRSFPSHAGL